MGERRAIAALRRMFLSDPVVDVAAAAGSALVQLGSEPSSRRDQGPVPTGVPDTETLGPS
jgi:HEAT repeat protein